MRSALDRQLDRELPRLLVRSSPPAYPRFLEMRPAGTRDRVRFGAVRPRFGTAVIVGVGIAFIATAGVGAKTVLTGSPNPLVWSHVTPPGAPHCNVRGSVAVAGTGGCASGAPRQTNAGADRRSTQPHPTGSAPAGASTVPGAVVGSSPAANPTPPPHPSQAPSPSGRSKPSHPPQAANLRHGSSTPAP